jgi:hypothetical protein
MKKDRLRNDDQEIHNLDDLIEARSPGPPHIREDRDALENDFELPEDTDVEEALTFPHPHHKKPDVETLDPLDEANMDEDWKDQDIMPSDYAHDYSEATTTDIRDDTDEIDEDEVHTMDHLSLDQISDERPTEVMPDDFAPDEQEGPP